MPSRTPRRMPSRLKGACSALMTLTAAACGDPTTGTGAESTLLEAEDTITHGIAAGDALENIRDGWNVQYDKFIVTIGHIRVHLSTDESVVARDDAVYMVDLTQVPAAGLALWQFDALTAGHWEFSFETPVADATTRRHSSVASADYDSLVGAAMTYLIDGTLTQAKGQSCPPPALATPGERTTNGASFGGSLCYDAPKVRFVFKAAVPTLFGPCELDGVPGFNVSDGSRQTVSATLHGDHMFFNGFPEGGEGGVRRRAQWLADSDLNLDGTVTQQELEAIQPAALPQIDDDVQLGGSPITPLNNMYDYVRAQLMTQGHMNGEGDCTYNRIHQDGGSP